jgi:DNA modification methylase
MSTINIYKGDNVQILRELKLDYKKCIFVSDPPFNVGYHYNTYSDNKPEEEYYNWLLDIFGHNKQVIVHYPESLYRHSFNIGMFPERVISWVYNSNTPRQHRDIAFFGVNPDLSQVGQPYKNLTDKRIQQRVKEGKEAKLYDWFEVDQVKNVNLEKTEHPAQMPLKVMENIIGVLPKDFTIIDPFLGSGTTAIACMTHDRDFIGIEIDEKYFNISQDRINQRNILMGMSNSTNNTQKELSLF